MEAKLPSEVCCCPEVWGGKAEEEYERHSDICMAEHARMLQPQTRREKVCRSSRAASTRKPRGTGEKQRAENRAASCSTSPPPSHAGDERM